MTILEAVGGLLNGQLGWVLGTNLLLARSLDTITTPDLCATLHEYEGQAPAETYGAELEMPRLQVMIRAGAEDYPAARDAALAVRGLLRAVVNQTLSGLYVLRIQPSGSVLPLGPDAHNRPRVSTNYQVFLG